MKQALFRLPFLLFLSTLLFGQQPALEASRSLALTNVTLIDVKAGKAASRMTIVIADGRIAGVGPTGQLAIPKNAQIVEANGKFLIPGLWDMHVHLEDAEQFFPLFIANGVTGIRDMGGSAPQFELNKKLREQVTRGEIIGPRIVLPGSFIDGPTPTFEGSIAVADGAQARQAVTVLKRQNADFIKIFDLLPRDAYFALADEANKQGLVFAGHTPISVSAMEASSARQKSMEHLLGVLLACSKKEARIRAELIEAIQKSNDRFSVVARRIFFAPPREILDTYSNRKAGALFAHFRRNGTWQCPTLVLWRNEAFINSQVAANDARLRYVPQSRKQTWNRNYFLLKPLTDADFDIAQQFYRKYLELTRAMHRAGVKFIAGTDAYNPYVYPGFSIHDELAAFVQAGFTPAEALRSATCDAAEFLGLADSLGTIAKGKIADLVLLDANPLEDIGNTKKINAVVLNGRLLDKKILDQMLAQVEVAANRK